MIYIFYTLINEDNHKDLINKYLPKFSTEFQKKVLRYRRWQDAQLSLLGRVLLVKGMEQMNYNFDDFDLKYTFYNKPYFDSIDMSFNISHSGKIVICALTRLGSIGIDIEKIKPIKITGFKSQMTKNEWESVNNSKDKIRSFFYHWSQKEAVIKTNGKGFTIPLKSFEIRNKKTTVGFENFFLKEITIKDDYSCHVALNRKIDTIEIKINKLDF
ncbi:4'-phosphopantetheinyl transferase family protein [Flavivirga jejuensis]|uniref:4'-phosphopantetheinyl transferase superfamily protein n=1 Tax=Flavivirga jejuensis TaxID=870487 RepID=A0ABT8WKC7_9FLAO|nr:4'-phosphopantetheinyl transferase superfamily protein [Flavivirga jejuensis]MDO5973611.1 4'-phosphopantetheinyl transferase superfamily protein [Flavivirga jejuensis]